MNAKASAPALSASPAVKPPEIAGQGRPARGAHERLSYWLIGVGTASVAYFLTARLGTALHLSSVHIAIAWPASGVALSAFHLTERRRWWLLAVAIGLANVAANWAVGASALTAAFASVADVLEAAGGALVLRRFDRRHVDMTRLRHVLGLVLAAALITPICAVIGTMVTPSGGETTFFERWRQWTIVDAVGMLFVAPAILGTAAWVRSPRRIPGAKRLWELSLVSLAAIATTWIAIASDMHALRSAWSSRYLVFPFLAWSALRAGPIGASLTALGISSAAIASAIASTGVLADRAGPDAVLALQLFICVATVTTSVISALDAQRRRAQKSLLKANRQLEARRQALEHEVRLHSESQARVAGLKDDLADVIDSMPIAIFAVDREDRIVQSNRSADLVLGSSGKDELGRPAAQVLADFWPAVERSRAEPPAAANAFRSQRTHVEREGARRTYAVTFYPLTRGYIQGGVVMIGDVTEQERLQEVITQTEKMISLGGLAAGMAHEINNPLGIIAQAAQNVQRRTAADLPANQQAAQAAGISLDGLQRYLGERKVHDFINDIRAAAARAATIVANMLEFSRRSPTAKARVDVIEVLERALGLAASDFDLRKQYDFRRVEIVRDYAASMPAVEGVAIELEQVFLNLIKNAAQAMAMGGQTSPRLTLTARVDDRYALVTVEDNGPGMDDATRRRVFEPFFTTKEPGVGTGLGLSVSFAIITRNHKGMIEVRSLKGEGAAFTVRLPFAPEAAP